MSGSWLVERGTALLGRKVSRRGFLVRAAVAGTAVAVNPLNYLLKPMTAYAAICGCAGYSCDCGSACCEGYTAFCCEVNGGVNVCPVGSFPGGWWRADGSIFCDGTRYIVDCNLSCDADWWPGCGCAQGDCGRRVSACNWFRYGQCNEHIGCYGPIVCRMATCEPPYNLDLGCSDWALWDNSTANHAADCASDGSDASRSGERGGGGAGDEGDGGDPEREA
ncbi:MAG: twin-arginine translocation signal domain-containing protein, partial [Acidimicrobiales bacterium]